MREHRDNLKRAIMERCRVLVPQRDRRRVSQELGNAAENFDEWPEVLRNDRVLRGLVDECAPLIELIDKLEEFAGGVV